MVETSQTGDPGICLLSIATAAMGDFLKTPLLDSNQVIRASHSEKLVAEKQSG